MRLSNDEGQTIIVGVRRVKLETRIFPELSDDGDGDEKASVKPQLQAGVTLANRYLVQEVVGLGGMGSVYRSRDMHFPSVTKLVAVKEMIISAPDPLVRETIVKNFEREANLLATLHHPSIPKIYDYFTLDSRSYLVLEFIHGKDLEAVINDTNGFLPEDQLLHWAIDLCDVLDYLHKHKPDPIIFRDMKPSNVMINSNGMLMLVDFGIAKAFQTGIKGTMIGTEGYSPPEQYRGEATPTADVYSLGATLHHVLTRRDPRLEPPFSFAERPIRRINPSISNELEVIVNRALEYEPASRFQSAAEMRDALKAVARKTGVLLRPGSSTGPIKTDGIKPLWKFKCEDEIRGTPAISDGSLYIGSYDNNLYSLDASDGKFQWKYPTEGGIVSCPSIVDGNIFIGSEDKLLHVVSARSGKVVWTYYTDAPIRSSPRIAEGHVFIGSDDGYLHAVNVNTGRMVWRFESAGAVRSTPLVLNDMVYFGCEAGDYYAVNFRGDLKWRFRAKRAITSSTVGSKQTIYFTSMDSTLYALDPSNGWALWRYRMGKASISTPCVADDIIIVGAADGFIYAVEAKSSKELWRFRTEHQVNGSPVIYKDSVYCGSVDGNLYCLEYRTGRLRWKFGTEAAITGTPFIYDDIVYIGSTDHHVYALLA